MIDCFDVRIRDRTTRFSSFLVCAGFKAFCAESGDLRTSPYLSHQNARFYLSFSFALLSFFVLPPVVCLLFKAGRFDEEDRNSNTTTDDQVHFVHFVTTAVVANMELGHFYDAQNMHIA